MAEIVHLCRSGAPVEPVEPVEPVSWVGWLRQLLHRGHGRSRPGRADDLPDRLRHDIGLRARSPARDYREYLSEKIW